MINQAKRLVDRSVRCRKFWFKIEGNLKEHFDRQKYFGLGNSRQHLGTAVGVGGGWKSNNPMSGLLVLGSGLS